VLLTRIVSVLYYPVGVYFVISLALLGSAAGSVFVALAARRMQHMAQTAASACLLLAVGILVALMAVAHASAQPMTLVMLALALALPFLGGGLAVSLLFSANPGRANWLYFADLGGAGLGRFGFTVCSGHRHRR
jgi:hypothetical protein